ncbi:MAG TPA: hypothetical protein PKJ69_07495 [Spirochaetota bacterium]|nr:hypothetical protein [Spirochaetota bacterium]
MEIITVFGVRWRVAPLWEVLVTLFVILVIIGFFALLRYNQYLKLKKSSIEQLFIYKARQRGLTGYQIRILQHIVALSKLSSPEVIFNNVTIFETGLVKFLQYIKKSRDTFNEDLKDIFKDIVITYERIYNPVEYQEPINSPDELTADTMLCGYSATGRAFIAKITQITEDAIHCKYFRKPEDIPADIIAEQVTIFFFRNGDAEYSFDSKIIAIQENTIVLQKPQAFKRGKEVHHPYIQTLIPCTIQLKNDESKNSEEVIIQHDETVSINGTIERLNEYEAVIRVEERLEYQKEYILFFTLENFKIEILSTIIASRTITKEKIIYYTFKLVQMSEAAKNVISKYVKERL